MKKRFLGIAQKIILPLVVTGTLLLSLVVFAEIGLNTVNGLISSVIDRNVERAVLSLRVLDDVNLATIKEKNTLLEKSPAQLEKNMGEYRELMASASDNLDRMKSIAEPNDLPALLVLADLLARSRDLAEKTEFPLIRLGKIDQAYVLSFSEEEGGGRALRQHLRAGLQKIVEANQREISQSREAAQTTSERTKNLLVLLAAIGLCSALIWISAIHLARSANSETTDAGMMFHDKSNDKNNETNRKDEVAVIELALKMFKENAAEARRLAEAEEKDCENLLKSIKKDSE